MFAVALAMAFLTPRLTLAQTSAADVSLARQLGNEGLALAASGDCAGAVEKLKRAEGIYHAPTTLTVLGECHLTLGKLVDGVEELTRVVREDIGPTSPAAFRRAQVRARKKLDAARPRLPKLRLTVDGARSEDAITLRIDGQPVPTATLGLDRAVDPGPHDVEATAIGYQPASAHVVMREGASQAVTLTLEPIPAAPVPSLPASPVAQANPPAVTAPATSSRSSTPPPEAAKSASYLPAALLLAVGAAGIGVGAVLGVMTLGKASHLSDTCQPRNDCPASEQGDIDSAGNFALGSTIGFGVGIVGVGLGTYFLLKPPRHDRAPATTGLTVRPWVGPGSAGFTGSF